MIDIHSDIQTLSISRSFVKCTKWVSRLGHFIVLFCTKELRPQKLYIFYIHFHTNFQDPVFSGGRDASTSEVGMTVMLIYLKLACYNVRGSYRKS